jgi:hypothetical protein
MDSRGNLFRSASAKAALLLPAVSFLLIAGQVAAPSGDDTPTFKSGVNEVMVPVVVRDADGHVVTDLRKEDFTLLDNGKPQDITSFRVEKPGQHVAVARPVEEVNTPSAGSQAESAKGAPMVMPDHFIA